MNLQNAMTNFQHQFFQENGDESLTAMPQDFKEMFDQSTGSDSDNEINLRSQNNSVQESIIFDEEYEIFTKPLLFVEKSCLRTCPFCYKFTNSEQFVYNSFLNSYYCVHSACCKKFQAKDLGFKAHSFLQNKILMCETFYNEAPHLQPTLTTLEDVKVFIELKVFHPISVTPLICMNHSAVLQHRRHSNDGLVQLDMGLLEMQNKLYQAKRIYIPFLQARITADIYIFDPLQPHTNKFQENFLFTISQTSGKVVMKSLDQHIILKGIIEEKNIHEMSKETSFAYDCDLLGECKVPIFNMKSLTFTFPQLLKLLQFCNIYIRNRNLCNTTSKTSSATPKTEPMTPRVLNVSPSVITCASRARLPSFNLNEPNSPEQNYLIEDTWTEDITNIEQIRGKISLLVKTQQGSRLIQKFFSTCSQTDLDVVIREVEDQIPDLMIDPYANYLFGSLSSSCVPSQRVHILRIISARLIEIACDKKGTHAVQGLVSLISSRLEEELIEKAIKNQIVHLVLDSQGTHLIKKIICRFAEDKLGFILNSLLDQFLLVVNHQYGLCVMKDLMTKFCVNPDKSQLILRKILCHLDEIIQDPYGNYAIQHAMDVYGETNCGCLIERVLEKIVQLSIHKYSSNVVEKCIMDSSQVFIKIYNMLKSTKRKFIVALSKEDVNLELMKNKFGSFVLQKALSMDTHRCLLSSLQKNVSSLYAPNIRQKWQDFLDARKSY